MGREYWIGVVGMRGGWLVDEGRDGRNVVALRVFDRGWGAGLGCEGTGEEGVVLY